MSKFKPGDEVVLINKESPFNTLLKHLCVGQTLIVKETLKVFSTDAIVLIGDSRPSVYRADRFIHADSDPLTKAMHCIYE